MQNEKMGLNGGKIYPYLKKTSHKFPFNLKTITSKKALFIKRL